VHWNGIIKWNPYTFCLDVCVVTLVIILLLYFIYLRLTLYTGVPLSVQIDATCNVCFLICVLYNIIEKRFILIYAIIWQLFKKIPFEYQCSIYLFITFIILYTRCTEYLLNIFIILIYLGICELYNLLFKYIFRLESKPINSYE